ncbi:MAG: hypothetical protein AAF291_16080 [Pseudomonadota bacterium]
MLFTSLVTSLFLMQAAPEPQTDTQAQAQATAEDAAEEKAQPGPQTSTEPNIDVVEEKPKKITDKRHPDYIRCKSEAVIGSRARRKRTCMTNRDWELVQRRGNEASRDFVDQNQPGFMSGQGG